MAEKLGRQNLPKEAEAGSRNKLWQGVLERSAWFRVRAFPHNILIGWCFPTAKGSQLFVQICKPSSWVSKKACTSNLIRLVI
jgi:hypothetical protein